MQCIIKMKVNMIAMTLMILSVMSGINTYSYINSTFPYPFHQDYEVEKTKHEVIDQVIMYPNLGILLEPSGQYLTYAGLSIVPFTYMIPKYQPRESVCRGSKEAIEIEAMYKHAVEHVRSTMVPKRSKRFIGAILSTVSLSASLYNTMEISTIKGHLAALDKYDDKINSHLANVTESTNLLIDNYKTMAALIGDHTEQLQQLTTQFECRLTINTNFFAFLTSWMTTVPQEFLRAYNSAVQGVVDIELITAKNLKLILSGHPELQNSAYSTNPSLVYTLGKVLLTEVNVDDRPYLRGIIYLPKLITRSPLPTYNIYTVNFKNENKHMRLILPPKMICTSRFSCWEPFMQRCQTFSTYLLCVHSGSEPMNQCISSLPKGDLSHCEVHSTESLVHSYAFQLTSGVLIGAHTTEIKLMKMNNGVALHDQMIPHNDKPVLYNSTSCDHLIFQNDVFTTRMTGFDYNITIVEEEIPSSLSLIPLSKDSHGWKPIYHTPPTPVLTHLSENHHYYLWLVLLFLILGLGGLVYYKYGHLRQLYSHPKIDIDSIH